MKTFMIHELKIGPDKKPTAEANRLTQTIDRSRADYTYLLISKERRQESAYGHRLHNPYVTTAIYTYVFDGTTFGRVVREPKDGQVSIHNRICSLCGDRHYENLSEWHYKPGSTGTCFCGDEKRQECALDAHRYVFKKDLTVDDLKCPKCGAVNWKFLFTQGTIDDLCGNCGAEMDVVKMGYSEEVAKSLRERRLKQA